VRRWQRCRRVDPLFKPGASSWVAIDLQRVDAADQIGAAAHRRVEQVEDAGAAHDAALRKGDDLHAHKSAVPLARGEHAVELQKAAFEIDVDMGAQMRGAVRHARLDQIAGAFLGGDRQVWQDRLVRLDAANPCRSRHMRRPRQPHQGLVEMHVTIDEAGQYQVAADIEDRYAVRQRWRRVLADRRDTPADDPDIDEAPVGEAAMGQECVEVHDMFLAETRLRHVVLKPPRLALWRQKLPSGANHPNGLSGRNGDALQ